MTKHHGWCHTGCHPGPHSWWPDTAWQHQSRLPDKAPQTSCPMSCCQSDYTVFTCHELVATQYRKMNLFLGACMQIMAIYWYFQRWHLCWAAGLAWVIHEQTFIFPSHWSWWTSGHYVRGYCTLNPLRSCGLGEPCGHGSCSCWCCWDVQFASCSQWATFCGPTTASVRKWSTFYFKDLSALFLILPPKNTKWIRTPPETKCC